MVHDHCRYWLLEEVLIALSPYLAGFMAFSLFVWCHVLSLQAAANFAACCKAVQILLHEAHIRYHILDADSMLSYGHGNLRSDRCCRSSGKRSVKICGIQRTAVVAVVLSFGLLLLWYSKAHLTVLWAMLTGKQIHSDSVKQFAIV